MIAQRLEAVRQRIADACHRAGRPSSAVTLIAVTKGVPAERVREAVAAGVTDVGENRVQEALQKQQALGMQVHWHLIGHLQRNKASVAARAFTMVHSVDSLALAQVLDRHRHGTAAPLDVLMQVNVSGEPTKSGCHPEDAQSLAAGVRALPHLRLCGLMTIAPLGEDARPVFGTLREVRDRLQAQGFEGLKLSMGMSQDFEVAIEEGADFVRIGTAIFGARDG